MEAFDGGGDSEGDVYGEGVDPQRGTAIEILSELSSRLIFDVPIITRTVHGMFEMRWGIDDFTTVCQVHEDCAVSVLYMSEAGRMVVQLFRGANAPVQAVDLLEVSPALMGVFN